MNRFFRIVLVLALLVGVAHADFVGGNTSLPTTKTNLHPLPSTADPTKYFQAADYNALMNAELDLRTAIVNGAYHGLAEQATDPLPVNATNYEWLDTSGLLHLKIGATGALVPFCTPTTPGDYCGWNGTNWTREPAPTGGGSSSLSAIYNASGATGNTIAETSAGGTVGITGAASATAPNLTLTQGAGGSTGAINVVNSSSSITGLITFLGQFFGSRFVSLDGNSGIITPNASSLTLESNGFNITVPSTANDTMCVLAATQTLSSKTFLSPAFSGTVTGTYTLGGTPTIASPVMSGGLTASGSGSYDFSGSTGTWKPPTGGLAAGLSFSAANSFPVGSLSFPASASYVQTYYSAAHTYSGGGAITIGSQVGHQVIVQLGSTATTAITMQTGFAFDQQIVVLVKQDATGSRACPTTWTNVTFAGGTYVVSTGANKTDALTLEWDNTSSLWRETSRALNE